MAPPAVKSRTSPTERGRPHSRTARWAKWAHLHTPAWPELPPWWILTLTLWAIGTRRFVAWIFRWPEGFVPLGCAIAVMVRVGGRPGLIAGVVAGHLVRLAFIAVEERLERRRERWHLRAQWRRACSKVGIVPAPKVRRSYATVAVLDLDVVLPEVTDPVPWQRVRSHLASVYRARCNMHELRPGVYRVTIVRIDLLVVDQLIDELRPATHSAVPTGIDFRGESVSWPIFEAHWLLAGTTGSGKSTSMFSWLAHLLTLPDTIVWVADAQDGVSFAAWEHLVDRVGDTDETILAMLEDAVTEMRRRGMMLRERRVTFREPSADWPMLVVVLDEFGILTDHPDKAIRDRVRMLSWMLLRQGRKCGVAVVAAMQDPRVDILPNRIRSLFSHIMCLRVQSTTMSNVVLPEGLASEGWNASKVPGFQPGRGIGFDSVYPKEVRCLRMYEPPKELDSRRLHRRPLPQPARPTGDLSVTDAATLHVVDEGFADDSVTRPISSMPTREVIRCVVAEAGDVGVTSREIAARVGLSDRQVRRHLGGLPVRRVGHGYVLVDRDG